MRADVMAQLSGIVTGARVSLWFRAKMRDGIVLDVTPYGKVRVWIAELHHETKRNWQDLKVLR